MDAGRGAAMDEAVTRWINSAAGLSPALDAAMVALSEYGVPVLVACVVLQWWSRAARPHARHAAVAAGLSFLIGLGLNQVILVFVQRVRPYDTGVSHLIVPPSADWSFPSDHATAAFAIVAAFALQAMPRRTLLLALVAVLIVWSRVFVGTHYATDVLGGAVTGLVAAVAVRAAYREGSRVDRMLTGIL